MAKKYNPWTGFLEETTAKANDEKSTIDKAIRNCDSNVKLVKTVAKKSGYAIHIVSGEYGERIVLTFPGENYNNPHMWLGSNTPSNMSKAQEMLLKMAASSKDSKCKTAVDKAIRACDSKFNKGDIVKIGGSIYKIVGVREKEQKYDLREILGGGSIYSFDIVEGRGTKLSSFPKGIFTDQWGNKWEITPNDSESYNAKHIKTGERKVFKNDWLRYGGKVEWK